MMHLTVLAVTTAVILWQPTSLNVTKEEEAQITTGVVKVTIELPRVITHIDCPPPPRPEGR